MDQTNKEDIVKAAAIGGLALLLGKKLLKKKTSKSLVDNFGAKSKKPDIFSSLDRDQVLDAVHDINTTIQTRR